MINYPDFTNMTVWQKSFDLGFFIYEITKEFPDDEKYGLISDTKRKIKPDFTKYQGEAVMK